MSSNESISVFEIAKNILQVGPSGKVNRNSRPVTEGLVPKRPRIRKEGIFTLPPEELLTVRIERLSDTGSGVTGYQRPLIVSHARAIARAYGQGRNIAMPTLALDSDGELYAPDGQHRILGAIIAGRAIDVVIEVLDRTARAERFSSQVLARRPGAEVLILGRVDWDPIAAYIRDAIDAEKNGASHALAGFVGLRADKKRIGVPTAYEFLIRYALNTINNEGHRVLAEGETRRIEPGILDEAAMLLQAFGPKLTASQHVYAPPTVRALATVAVLGVRRAPDRARAVRRWGEVMPRFPWGRVGALETTFKPMKIKLARHWNRNLPRGFEKILEYS